MYRFGGMSSSSGSSGSGDWLQDLEDSTKEAVQKAKLAGATFMWRTAWTYSDELMALKNDEAVLVTRRLAETNQFFPSGITTGIYDAVWEGLDDTNLRRMFSGYAGSLSASVRKVMAAEASKRIVITAIALKRFRLKHGNFPEHLAELTPDFLATTLMDPADGKPLRYERKTDDTYLLYSIGDDGVDNGGDPTSPVSTTSFSFNWQGNHVRDWVWPQPATVAEIEAFYAHPPK